MQAETSTELEIVQVDGEIRLDSRLMAKNLGIEHEVFIRTLRKYQPQMEELGLIRFENGVKSGAQRGKLPQYVMLNEDQSIFAATLSRNSDQVVAFKLALTKAFKEAREKLNQQSAEPTQVGIANSLWVKRSQLFAEKNKIASDKYCVFRETSMDFLELDLKGCGFPEGALPDGSIGKRWCTYAREVLRFDMSLVTKYPHHYPDKRGVQPAYLYPIEWLPAFRKWFKEVYIPVHLPDYLSYLKVPQPDIQRIMLGFNITYQIKEKKRK